MAIPKYDSMYRAFLEALSDGKCHKIGEIRDHIAEKFQITDAERKQLLPSGKQKLFYNRVTWTCAYLKGACLIENTSRGVYQLSNLGKKVILESPEKIDNDFLSQFASFRQFISFKKEKVNRDSTVSSLTVQNLLSDQTPQDIFDDAYDKINDALMEDVLSEVMKQTPAFFELLVVKLLTKMGYGGSLDGAGSVTRISGDEGIDGIIREDKLGFDKIYIQAKRWDRNSTVGRPEIQKFVGALVGQGASKGLFITTARFSKEAKEYAGKQHTTKIVLIDGMVLAKLMIEYNLGVSVEATYEIKKIDSDFFDDN